jgi:hypothetical protein
VIVESALLGYVAVAFYTVYIIDRSGERGRLGKSAADIFEQVVPSQRHGLGAAAYSFARVTINTANAFACMETGQIDGRARVGAIHILSLWIGVARRAKGVVIF